MAQHHDSILQYLQLNKHLVSFPVLHACEFQIRQRLKRTLNINWLKAERMEVRTEGSLWDWNCYTFALLPNDIECEAWISTEIKRGIQSGLWRVWSCCRLVGISVDWVRGELNTRHIKICVIQASLWCRLNTSNCGNLPKGKHSKLRWLIQEQICQKKRKLIYLKLH